MISKLIIRNFRSNKRLDIDLDPHVTCITGESYTGKSNAIRAFKWAALNRPAGKGFIRWGSDHCIVRIDVGKHTISRQRSKSINTYKVDGNALEAFGNNVPDKVQKIVNLSEINFQTQQEMPPGSGPLFWFALTPGQVSKNLNRIVNLDLIDRTLANLQSGAHKAKSTLDVCRERREQARERKKALSFVKDMVAEWKDVVDSRRQAAALFIAVDALEGLLQDIIKQQLILKASKYHLNEADKALQELESLRTTIIGLDGRHKDLFLLLSEIGRFDQERSEAYEDLIVAEKEYNKALGTRCPLCGSKRKKR